MLSNGRKFLWKICFPRVRGFKAKVCATFVSAAMIEGCCEPYYYPLRLHRLARVPKGHWDKLRYGQ